MLRLLERVIMVGVNPQSDHFQDVRLGGGGGGLTQVPVQSWKPATHFPLFPWPLIYGNLLTSCTRM